MFIVWIQTDAISETIQWLKKFCGQCRYQVKIIWKKLHILYKNLSFSMGLYWAMFKTMQQQDTSLFYESST